MIEWTINEGSKCKWTFSHILTDVHAQDWMNQWWGHECHICMQRQLNISNTYWVFTIIINLKHLLFFQNSVNQTWGGEDYWYKINCNSVNNTLCQYFFWKKIPQGNFKLTNVYLLLKSVLTGVEHLWCLISVQKPLGYNVQKLQSFCLSCCRKRNLLNFSVNCYAMIHKCYAGHCRDFDNISWKYKYCQYPPPTIIARNFEVPISNLIHNNMNITWYS